LEVPSFLRCPVYREAPIGHRNVAAAWAQGPPPPFTWMSIQNVLCE
jgi:hypothetical protein